MFSPLKMQRRRGAFRYYIVTNANFARKIRAMIVATISFFVYLPVKTEIRTYAMQPMPIPLEMEYVRGIIMSARNAGTALLISLISTFAKFLSIRTPTKISAGAVAQEGTMFARGARKRQARKQSDVTKLAKPVLAPAATPEAHSTNVVQVEVPRAAPARVAVESQAIALFISMGSPFSSSIPASVAAP